MPPIYRNKSLGERKGKGEGGIGEWGREGVGGGGEGGVEERKGRGRGWGRGGCSLYGVAIQIKP